MLSSREVVKRAVRLAGPDRLPRTLPEPYGSDFAWVGMTPSPDARPSSGRDEWGALWTNFGTSNMGQVKEFPLRSWADFDRLKVPDITEPRRWEQLKGARERAGDKFLLAGGLSLYERVHFIRGLENTWADIYEAPDRLRTLIDVFVEMNLYAIERYAEEGADGYFWCDDWGLQNRLMIPGEAWRQIWKPAYARVYQAAHEAGLLTFLHSCGHIVEILEDLIDIDLDVIQMDQQENMGLELLGRRFAGRIAFWCPVDIQNTMARGNAEAIRAYARKMVHTLGRHEGGFICGYYGDPVGAGHTQAAVDAMCEEFLYISDELYGKPA
jgi:uroporphyrinogen decarboxylase